MSFERMLDRSKKPTENEIVNTIGTNSILWVEMRNYLNENLFTVHFF